MFQNARSYRSIAIGILMRLLVLLIPLLLCACQNATIELDPQECRMLERRATNLLLRAARSDDLELCCNAIEALVQVAPDQGLPHFRAALRSEYPLVRFAGLTALGTVRDSASLAAIRQCLSDPSPMVRLGAAFAAYCCGDTTKARLLVNALSDNPEERVRAEAAHLIGMLDESRAGKRLKLALRVKANMQSPLVRVAIQTALSRLGDHDAVIQLITYSQHDALSRLMALQSLAEISAEPARETLLYRLSEQEDYLLHRLLAARGLARIGSDAGYELALESCGYLSSNPDDPEDTCRIRVNAALTLGEIGNPQALTVLQGMAQDDEDPRLQVAACYAICRIIARVDVPEGD